MQAALANVLMTKYVFARNFYTGFKIIRFINDKKIIWSIKTILLPLKINTISKHCVEKKTKFFCRLLYH